MPTLQISQETQWISFPQSGMPNPHEETSSQNAASNDSTQLHAGPGSVPQDENPKSNGASRSPSMTQLRSSDDLPGKEYDISLSGALQPHRFHRINARSIKENRAIMKEHDDALNASPRLNLRPRMQFLQSHPWLTDVVGQQGGLCDWALNACKHLPSYSQTANEVSLDISLLSTMLTGSFFLGNCPIPWLRRLRVESISPRTNS